MKSKDQSQDDPALSHAHFDQLLNHGHLLVKLARQIDWPAFDAAFADCWCPDNGAPVKRIGDPC